jgi:putative inorganic carbon (HCO3(-)) transporter
MLLQRNNLIMLLLGAGYVVLSGFFIWQDLAVYCLFPLAIALVYAAIFYTEWVFLSLAFITPLSINIEEYTDSFGLFVPTEPILFGFLLLFVWLQLKKNLIQPDVWRHPIVVCVGIYLCWVFVTSITSSNPITSLKFLLSRIWFVVPLLLLGSHFFRKSENRERFIWLFLTGMVAAVIYTVTVHAGYRFGEKESHWVMWPFFKDHTIYGAIVALATPLVVGLFFWKKQQPLLQAIILGFIFIILTGLYFSYTRAAWLSVIAALVVWLFIHFKVRFSIIAVAVSLIGGMLYFSWDAIQMELERNKMEHTTEEFGERLQSATNVSTDASNLERINRWSCAMAMFEERPIWGFGPGTYAFEYARFQEPENLTIISTNFGNMGNAHSEYLGPLAEMGLPGFLSMLAIVVAIFYSSIQLYVKWPEDDRSGKVLLLSIILALTTYFVHGILNNFLDTDKAAVPIWGMCSIIISMEMQYKEKRNKSIST